MESTDMHSQVESSVWETEDAAAAQGLNQTNPDD